MSKSRKRQRRERDAEQILDHYRRELENAVPPETIDQAAKALRVILHQMPQEVRDD
jgi:hypothetical protein